MRTKKKRKKKGTKERKRKVRKKELMEMSGVFFFLFFFFFFFCIFQILKKSKKLRDLLLPSVQEDTKRKKNKQRYIHGMILEVMKTIIPMLFKQSCAVGKKYFPNWKMFRLEV